MDLNQYLKNPNSARAFLNKKTPVKPDLKPVNKTSSFLNKKEPKRTLKMNDRVFTESQLNTIVTSLVKAEVSKIPKAKDGETPSREDIKAVVTPLIPVIRQPKDGKDGEVTAKHLDEIVTKVLGQVSTTPDLTNAIVKVFKKEKVSAETLPGFTELRKRVEKLAENQKWMKQPMGGGYTDNDVKRVIDSYGGSVSVDDTAYGASWDGDTTTAASKNAIYDKIETLSSGHDPVTVTDSAEIDFTLTGQDITASLIAGSIDETKLDTSVNASLDLADEAVQPGDNISDLVNDAGYTTAASAFGTDNRLIRSDGTGKGVQASGITVDDGDNVTGVAEFAASGDVAVDTDTLFVDVSTDRVGIGEATPEGKLHIRDDTNSTVQMQGSNANWDFIVDGTTDGTSFGVQSSIGLYYQNNTPNGVINFSRGGNTQTGTISFDVNGSEAMIIKDSGFVGINTDTPSQRLEVAGSVLITDSGKGNSLRIDTAKGNIDFGEIGSSDDVGVRLRNLAGDEWKMQTVADRFSFAKTGTGGTEFEVGVNNNDSDDAYMQVGNAIRFNSNGNSYINNGTLGIGTTSTDTTLHVAGAVTQEPLSADPADPDAGNSVQWVSDGTGSGDAGDVMMKINVGGTVKTVTIIDYSAL